jgi:signal transduction histidine kinase/DNA-binding response OmpR family regulator
MTARTRRHSLLVVDDERQILESVQALFRRSYDVVTALSGQAGLEILAGTPPDLILTDQMMPDMPGDAFLKLALELAPDSVRLLFTGYADIEAVTRAVNHGKIFGYITKPWNTVELEALVGQAARHFELAEANRILTEELRQANRALEGKVVERTRAVEELEDYSECLLRSLGIGVLVVDPSGVVSSLNPKASAILDLEADAATGKRFDSLPALKPFAEELARSLSLGRQGAYQEARLDGRDDQPRHLGYEVNPVVGRASERRGAILTFNDISEIRQLQMQLSQSEKLSTIGQLAGGVAHEINNPLGVILGFAQMLLRQPLEEQNLRRVQNIERQALRCKEIVSSLLKFARRPRMETRPVELNALIDETLALMARQFEVEQVKLVKELQPGLPEVQGDPNELEQVFFNLIMNARDALGGPGEIRLQSRFFNGCVEVSVSDTGPGVSHALREKIFDPFFTTKEPGRGTGLGLSVSRGIARRHGGDVVAESGQGGGRFVVRLPAGALPCVTPPPPAPAPALPAQGLRVLVVDDEEDIRQLCIDYFTEQNEVVAVSNGREALERLAREPFGLVLLDIMMPELDGLTTLERVRSQGIAVPIVVMTGRVTEDVMEARDRLGIYDILEKPFNITELDRVLERLTGRSPV